MSLLPLLHQAASVVTSTGGLYGACIALAVAISVAAPSSTLRNEARATLKILLRIKQ
jgi:hypothetical protein